MRLRGTHYYTSLRCSGGLSLRPIIISQALFQNARKRALIFLICLAWQQIDYYLYWLS